MLLRYISVFVCMDQVKLNFIFLTVAISSISNSLQKIAATQFFFYKKIINFPFNVYFSDEKNKDIFEFYRLCFHF